MEIVKVAELILDQIKQLKDGRQWQRLQSLANRKAQTAAEYDKNMAMTLIRLKNGGEFILDGKKISEPPVSIMDKLARGICWREKLKMEQADAEYKLTVENLHCIQAELNGYQSMLRYFENIATDTI